MRWSFSSHRTFRRCQRQYFFGSIAANHKTKDRIRKEAYLLKQVKQLSTWKGTIIHQGIHKFVIPYLIDRKSIDWSAVSDKTLDLAKRQFAFSKALKYRQQGIAKSHHDDYCILTEHDRGEEVPTEIIDKIYNDIIDCLNGTTFQKEIIPFVEGQKGYYSERNLSQKYEGAQISAVADLIFTRPSGSVAIVDWKYEQDYSFGDHKHQVALYGWVLKHQWNIANPELIELYEVQLREGRIVRHEFNLSVMEELEDLMFQSIHEIRALCEDRKYADQDINDFEFARSGNSCAFCSFVKLCREVKRWEPTSSIFSN
jgi:CRISPR/Cas system-associated exonuclease Cas4 (RecB family)